MHYACLITQTKKGRSLMKKTFVTIMSVLICVALLAACGGGSTPAPAPAPSGGGAAPAAPTAAPIHWRIQAFTGTGTYLYDGQFMQFVDNVNTMAAGRLILEEFPSGAIVPSMEGVQAVRDGILDAMFEHGAQWASIDMGFSLFTGSPGLFHDLRDYWSWWFYGGGREIIQKWADHYNLNVHVIYAGNVDAENFMWSDHPITDIEHMRGLNMRMMPIMGTILANNGLSVVFMDGGEVVPALERGVLDAAEFSIPALDRTFGFHDVSSYVTRPGIHTPSSNNFISINKDRWNELSPDLQRIIEVAGKTMSFDGAAHTIIANQEAIEYFESQGVTVVSLSSDAIATMQEWIDAYYEVNAPAGSLMREVIDSQRAWMIRYAPYKDVILGIGYPAWALQ